MMYNVVLMLTFGDGGESWTKSPVSPAEQVTVRPAPAKLSRATLLADPLTPPPVVITA